MYHPYSKNNPLLRKALYETYSKKCSYCGDLIQPKNMHVDHILATNAKSLCDSDFYQYIDELNSDGFVLDSIENYIPSCAACNLRKNNRNFSVANLRFFHSEAKSKVKKILSIIAKYKDQPISFDEFDPDYDYWERIDFSHQKDISEAVAGYRLQPYHVCACPRLVQVEEIKKRLDIVDYVIVEGEPGCGKSISVYQAAFDLSAEGYAVYRYINKNTEGAVFLPQSNEKKHLIIIDDAQNLPHFLLEQIFSQSQKQTKIILAFTKLGTDTSLYSEPIKITCFDAVKAIAQDYEKRKPEILPIVRKFDRFVGDGMMDFSFESRIKNAATKNTPWLFNYTLRGGWNTTNEQFQSVYNHNKCGLLSMIVALFQILKMDNTIDFTWLQTYIQKFDENIYWTQDDLDYLIKNKLVASLDDVRIVHIESAKSIIHNFYKVADEFSKQLMDAFDFHFIDHVCGISHFSPHKPTKQQRDFSKKFVDALPAIPIANFISHSLPRDWHRIYDIGRLLYRENKKLYSKIVKSISYDALSQSTSTLWKKTDGDLHLLFCFIAYGDSVSGQYFFATNKNKIEELGLPFIGILPEQSIELFEKGVKFRLFENHWNNRTFYALKDLHSVSETKYKLILNSETSQIASQISEFCILDFEKNEKTLTEILMYIKETHPSVFGEIVPLLNFSKMKKEKLQMLKDSRCGRRCKQKYLEMIDLLIEFSDETNIEELNSLKALK